MKTAVEILESMELFSTLEPSEISKIASIMSLSKVHEGEVLTRAGNLATHFYVVVSGDYMVAFETGKAFTIHNPGDVIGLNTLMAFGRYTGTGTAMTSGYVLVMEGEEFMRLIQSSSAIGDKIMHSSKAEVAARHPYTVAD